jgi:hypothetical protein
MLDQLLKFFVVFFVVVEPVSLIPLFSGLTDGASDGYKHKMALKSVLVAGLILVLFALGGATFLSLAGISIDAFRIFGGLLLFLIALEMVFARESRSTCGVPTSPCFRSPFRSSRGRARSRPSCCGSGRCTSGRSRCSSRVSSSASQQCSL